jgi:hypothetical protein
MHEGRIYYSISIYLTPMGVETGRPRSALYSHGVIGPLKIISASRITTNLASIFA